MSVGRAYQGVLPENHRKALSTACDMLIDEGLQDIGDLNGRGSSPSDTVLFDLLPRQYRHKYTERII